MLQGSFQKKLSCLTLHLILQGCILGLMHKLKYEMHLGRLVSNRSAHFEQNATNSGSNEIPVIHFPKCKFSIIEGRHNADAFNLILDSVWRNLCQH